MRFGSSNPIFKKISQNEVYSEGYEVASYKGVAAKSLYFIVISFVGAFAAILLLEKKPQLLVNLLIPSAIVTLITSIIAFVSPKAAKVCGTIYCLFEGLTVGLLSLVLEQAIPGVVISALLGTMSVVLVTSLLYFSGVVRVTRKFVKFLLIAVLSIIFTQIIMFIGSLISPAFQAMLNNYTVSLGISVLMIFIASLYIMFDLENIRQVVEGGQPKEMEWYASFGLVFTILWLYVEVLRLIAIIASRNNN